MSESVPMNQSTHDDLSAEMHNLKKVERPIVIEAITVARENGDLKENADYHAAREKQGHIEDRIKYIEDRLARSEIISVDTASAEHIIFGAIVTVQNLATSKEQVFELVSQDSVEPMKGKISSTSPIGKALIGKKRGEVADVQTPRGLKQFKVIDYK